MSGIVTEPSGNGSHTIIVNANAITGRKRNMAETDNVLGVGHGAVNVEMSLSGVSGMSSVEVRPTGLTAHIDHSGSNRRPPFW